jgi:hypothetical protein
MRKSLFLAAALTFSGSLLACTAQTGTTPVVSGGGSAVVPPQSGSLLPQLLWGMAQAEISVYASSHPSTTFTKSLTAVTAEVSNLGNLQNPSNPKTVAADVQSVIAAIPAGDIGTADMTHVKAVEAVVVPLLNAVN